MGIQHQCSRSGKGTVPAVYLFVCRFQALCTACFRMPMVPKRVLKPVFIGSLNDSRATSRRK